MHFHARLFFGSLQIVTENHKKLYNNYGENLYMQY